MGSQASYGALWGCIGAQSWAVLGLCKLVSGPIVIGVHGCWWVV